MVRLITLAQIGRHAHDTVATLTANSLGDVTYMIDPSLLKLSPGQHNVSLTGMLLTETATFTSS